MTLPQFPKPHPKIVDELKILCGDKVNEKCVHVYGFLGKLMIFDKQLTIFREKMLEDQSKI